jgi:hypothetical protein
MQAFSLIFVPISSGKSLGVFVEKIDGMNRGKSWSKYHFAASKLNNLPNF